MCSPQIPRTRVRTSCVRWEPAVCPHRTAALRPACAPSTARSTATMRPPGPCAARTTTTTETSVKCAAARVREGSTSSSSTMELVVSANLLIPPLYLLCVSNLSVFCVFAMTLLFKFYFTLILIV